MEDEDDDSILVLVEQFRQFNFTMPRTLQEDRDLNHPKTIRTLRKHKERRRRQGYCRRRKRHTRDGDLARAQEDRHRQKHAPRLLTKTPHQKSTESLEYQGLPEAEEYCAVDSDATFEQEEEDIEEEEEEEAAEEVDDLWVQKKTVDDEIYSEEVDSQDEGPLFYARKGMGSRGRRGGARPLKSRE